MNIKRRTLYIVGIALPIVGCVSLETLAPPVDEGRMHASESDDAIALQYGRRIYLARCGGCHALERIDDRTEEQWRRILPKMVDKARLDTNQHAQLQAYIEAVLTASRRPSP